MDHWKTIKKVMRYLKCTKDFMHTYNSSVDLDIVGYPDSNFARSANVMKSMSCYLFKIASEAVYGKMLRVCSLL